MPPPFLFLPRHLLLDFSAPNPNKLACSSNHSLSFSLSLSLILSLSAALSDSLPLCHGQKSTRQQQHSTPATLIFFSTASHGALLLTALLLSTEQTNSCCSTLTHRKHSSAGKLAAGSRRPLLLSPLSFHPSEASTLFSLLSIGFPRQAAALSLPTCTHACKQLILTSLSLLVHMHAHSRTHLSHVFSLAAHMHAHHRSDGE